MEFFIIENGQQAGPFSLNQLVEKQISAETLVWAQGMTDWTPAWKVDDLKLVLDEIERQKNETTTNTVNQAGETGATPPPTSSTGSNNQSLGDFSNQQPIFQQETAPKKKKSGKLIWKAIAAVLVALFLCMAFTNPNAEAHKKAITLEVGTAVDSLTTGSDNNFFTQGFHAIAKMMADNLLGNALNDLFEYHNYIIFSKGTVNFDGKDHTISYGIFGKVITMNADDMINAIEKNGNVKIEESSSSSSSDDAMNEDNNAANDDATMDESTNNKNGDDFTEVDDNDTYDKDANNDIQSKLEEKGKKALDKISKKVGKKVEEKLSKKMDEVAADTSTIDKIIDAVLSFF